MQKQRQGDLTGKERSIPLFDELRLIDKELCRVSQGQIVGRLRIFVAKFGVDDHFSGLVGLNYINHDFCSQKLFSRNESYD